MIYYSKKDIKYNNEIMKAIKKNIEGSCSWVTPGATFFDEKNVISFLVQRKYTLNK